jgi:NAD(P)H dehydrogenase (quinone)
MKHLVIAAHPRADSLTMSLASAYVAELAELGHQHTLYNLYSMGFDPVLSSIEMAQPQSHFVSPVVQQAQQDIEAADAVTVFYPLWWLSMPAMMKGFIDRVFARGFAYESRQGVVQGLLTGRKCVIVTLSGTALPVLSGTGRWDAVTMLQDTHVFSAVGFELLEHLHFDHIEHGLPATAVSEHLVRVRDCARQHFGPCARGGTAIAQPSLRRSAG